MYVRTTLYVLGKKFKYYTFVYINEHCDLNINNASFCISQYDETFLDICFFRHLVFYLYYNSILSNVSNLGICNN